MQRFEIHTDGGADPNPGIGGYGAVIVSDAGRYELSQGYIYTTNNRMEIRAAVAALQSIAKRSLIELYSDSKLLVRAASEGWIRKWKKSGWVRPKSRFSEGGELKNADLWQLLDIELERHQCLFHWVKGHAGNARNERCDALAFSCRAHSLIEDVGMTPPVLGTLPPR